MLLHTLLMLAALPPPCGVIEGMASYPAEALSPTLEVCAERRVDGLERCTRSFVIRADYPSGWGFLLSVPPGDYVVFARSADLPGFRAWHNGSGWSGQGGTPLLVTVRAGHVVFGVDPGDWYTANRTAVGCKTSLKPKHPLRRAATPTHPPTNELLLPWPMYCAQTSSGRAATAMRRPISRARSLTHTSRRFMMPMPPTTRRTSEMPDNTDVR